MADPRRSTLVLQLMLARAVGLALAIAGVLLWRSYPSDTSQSLWGRIIIAAGLFVILVVPALLRRQARRRP